MAAATGGPGATSPPCGETYAATATTVLALGILNVGMRESSAINSNNYVNGWVMVTS